MLAGIKGSQVYIVIGKSKNNHNLKYAFTKVVYFGTLIMEVLTEVDEMQSFVCKSSFGHNLRKHASLYKTSSTKVVQFKFEFASTQSFGQKAYFFRAWTKLPVKIHNLFSFVY